MFEIVEASGTFVLIYDGEAVFASRHMWEINCELWIMSILIGVIGVARFNVGEA